MPQIQHLILLFGGSNSSHLFHMLSYKNVWLSRDDVKYAIGFNHYGNLITNGRAFDFQQWANG